MKKILFLISIFSFLIINPVTFAAATPSANSVIPDNIDLTKQIDALKDKVASKVAQLKLVEKRGIVGRVTDITDTQITLSDLDENVRFVDVDEFTKFSSPDASGQFGISDIKKGNFIGVLGLYNKESRRTLGRFINVMDTPTFISGVVAELDEDNFSLLVATKSGNVKVNITDVTKSFDIDDAGKLTKSGFTKISANENIVVSGFFDPKNKEVLTAGRIFLFPGVPQNPAIQVEVPQVVNPSIVPSTGSGKKLTPIVK